MQFILNLESKRQVAVFSNGEFSHHFDMDSLQLGKWDSGLNAWILRDPVEMGKSLYEALFRKGSIAIDCLRKHSSRVVLIAEQEALDAIPWEFLYGPEGYLSLDYPLIRGVSHKKQFRPLDLGQSSLHVVAVPSNPINACPPLDIEGEWLRLCEIFQDLKYDLTLERVHPPTLSELRRVVANQKNRVVHFIGHGNPYDSGAALQFENEIGQGEGATAKNFIRRIGGTAFLVTLNACVTASSSTSSPVHSQRTSFANIARALVEYGIPYSLGMRFVVSDSDAKIFSRCLYDELARGTSVEEAMVQVRNEMVKSDNPWAVGTPVLYTSLSDPAPGFVPHVGTPYIKEDKLNEDIHIVLPRAQGAFRGRRHELLTLGKELTGDPRPALLTIHGGGGIGKTALTREAVERFAHAWPGGVWAISLETVPTRTVFLNRLADYLSIPTDDIQGPHKLEKQILSVLNQRRTLIVLDNAETLLEAAEEDDEDALKIVAFLRERLLGTLASLLVTSRHNLGWAGEYMLSLDGLSPEEGARLFRQSAPVRGKMVEIEEAKDLSEQVMGHPLSLQLLGLTFDEVDLTLEAYREQLGHHLRSAEDKYKGKGHRHRTLFASFETSVQYLSEDLKALLSGLWIFHAPFLPEAAEEIFAHLPVRDYKPGGGESSVADRLFRLYKRGMLIRDERRFRDGRLLVYRLLPAIRVFTEEMDQAYPEEEVMKRFGAVYVEMVGLVKDAIDSGGAFVWLAQRSGEDFLRGIDYVGEEEKGWSQAHWGEVLYRLGDRQTALSLLEKSLEVAKGQYPAIEMLALIDIGAVYHSLGQPERALELYEKSLSIQREQGGRAEKAATLNNMGALYQDMGQPERALELYEQALPIMEEVGDLAGEASTLNNMGEVYRTMGQPERALELYEQALPIKEEVGDLAGEASALNKTGMVYQSMGQPRKALELYKKALPITKEVGDLAREVGTLNNMGMVYQSTGEPERALELYEKVLPVTREMRYRAGEAIILNNLGMVYEATGESGRAMELYEKALFIRREVGDRSGEGDTECVNDLRQLNS